MIEVITDDKHRVAEWAKKQYAQYADNPWRSGFQAFGLQKDGELVGAVIFSDYTGNDIVVSTVSTDPACWNRRCIRLLHEYVFHTCKCVRVTAMARASNRKSIKLLLGLGFKEEGRLRSYFHPEDAVVFGQLRSECKWIAS